MSAARPQLAPDSRRGRTPIAHLLHALNQPLTGLQCSLELALARPRTIEGYQSMMREGLELMARMRILVAALRELEEAEKPDHEQHEIVALDRLLRETVDDLRLVAAAKGIEIQFGEHGVLQVECARGKLAAATFRFLESVTSLAAPGSLVRIATSPERDVALITVGWEQGADAPEHSPYSRQEVGLLIAREVWEQAGALWQSERAGRRHTLTLTMPLACGTNRLNRENAEQ
jgi:signal transduction histidine kinase